MTSAICTQCDHPHGRGLHCYWCCDRLHGLHDEYLCRGAHGQRLKPAAALAPQGLCLPRFDRFLEFDNLVSSASQLRIDPQKYIRQAADSLPPLRTLFMTGADAATALGVARKTVERWIASGRLRGERVGRKHSVVLVAIADVERLKAQRPPRPRTIEASAGLMDQQSPTGQGPIKGRTYRGRDHPRTLP